MNPRCRLAIHGGAGVIDRASLSPAREAEFRGALARIAGDAWHALMHGASALDVVEQAVCDLEDFPLFNAGHGAVLNAEGLAEMDAAIMDGHTRRAGAVAGVLSPKHPVSLARAVMEQSEHVFLVGPEADRFAQLCAVPRMPPSYFITPERAEQQRQAAALGRITLDHDALYNQGALRDKTGTVGAVARDLDGHLAAATSTGGMTNKRPGRVGDSPVIGAGTFADDDSVAVSATGHGEYFIRAVLAHDIHARMTYGRQPLAEASREALAKVRALGGSGGLIAVDRDGELALPYNTEGMYRAWVGADGQIQVAIYAA